MGNSKPTPVADMDTMLIIIQHLKGDVGDGIREQMAVLVRRFIAGDQTLHTEINHNATSDHPINQIARETTQNTGITDNQQPCILNVKDTDPIGVIFQMDTPQAMHFKHEIIGMMLVKQKADTEKAMSESEKAKIEKDAAKKEAEQRFDAAKKEAELRFNYQEKLNAIYIEEAKLKLASAREAAMSENEKKRIERARMRKERIETNKSINASSCGKRDKAEKTTDKPKPKPKPRSRKAKSTETPIVEAIPTAISTTNIAEMDGPKSYSAVIAQAASSPQQPAVVQAL